MRWQKISLSILTGELIAAVTGEAAVRGLTINHGDGNRGENPLTPLEVTLTKWQWRPLRVPLVAREPQTTI